MMKLKLNKLLIFMGLFSVGLLNAQDSKYGTLINSVSAVVGDEIIIQSEIDRDFEMSKLQGTEIEDKCAFLENILVQKLILSHAKTDTLINISDDRIAASAEARINSIKSRGSDEEILNAYGLSSMTEFENLVKELVKESALIQQKQQSITKDIDASPKEVRKLYDEMKNDLPNIGEQIELSQIILYPELTQEHKQEIIDKLLKIKTDIENGDDFATKATLYSDDPGSASNGGLYKNISRGKFVPEFDAVAFNLQEGEISKPVETEFGFHIIKLDKRLGQNINVRHILIQPEYTEEEIKAAKDSLNVIKDKIAASELTFEEAARSYSKDKYTRFNGGKIVNPFTQESKFIRSDLPIQQVYATAGLKKGEMTDVFDIEYVRKPNDIIAYDRKNVIVLVKVDDIIPAHKMDIKTDYARLNNMTEQKLKQEKLQKWVAEKLPETYIKLNDELLKCNFELNWKKE